VTAEYDENVPEIAADRVQLQQAILNLVRNEIDAMEVVAPHARRLRLVTRFDGNSTAVLSIHDTGRGITAEAQRRIFEPFFTTKPNGMGLRLSICQAIIKEHQGELRLAKTGSRGSIFEIVLAIDPNKPIGADGSRAASLIRTSASGLHRHHRRPRDFGYWPFAAGLKRPLFGH
jgi:signal transduction histidine kinase